MGPKTGEKQEGKGDWLRNNASLGTPAEQKMWYQDQGADNAKDVKPGQEPAELGIREEEFQARLKSATKDWD